MSVTSQRDDEQHQHCSLKWKLIYKLRQLMHTLPTNTHKHKQFHAPTPHTTTHHHTPPHNHWQLNLPALPTAEHEGGRIRIIT